MSATASARRVAPRARPVARAATRTRGAWAAPVAVVLTGKELQTIADAFAFAREITGEAEPCALETRLRGDLEACVERALASFRLALRSAAKPVADRPA